MRSSSRFFIRFWYYSRKFDVFQRLQDTSDIFSHTGKSQYVKSKFKVFHKISVHVVYSCYISEVVVYIPAVSLIYMYSVVDIGKSHYVKSKFKVFHTISVHVVYFCYILEVVGYIMAISSYMYSINDVGKR